MVKVREFCCGCSLRSGTFTIAWSLLIYSTFLFISHVFHFFVIRRAVADFPQYYSEANLPSTYIFVYNVVRTFAGIAVSLTVLYALYKNKIALLNGLYWYLCYMVVSFIVSIILLIFKPNWEKALEETDAFLGNLLGFYRSPPIEHQISVSVFLFFIAGILTYFSLIVKSYRDYSLRNEAQNVQFVGPDATTVGYIAA